MSSTDCKIYDKLFSKTVSILFTITALETTLSTNKKNNRCISY